MKFAVYAISLSLFSAPVFAAPPQVVTDIPVTGSLVQQILGDLGEVHVLVKTGADPHDFQMRPSDARAIEKAGLLVWMGPELTPWLERATANLTNMETVELLDVDGTYLQSYGEKSPHAHGEEQEDEGHDHEDHDHESIDPHAWLDPINARLWLTEIARELAELDPENAAIYMANANDAAEELAKLENEIGMKLKPFANENLIVFHDAYGYFADHFGLKPAMAISLGDASAPSAARISQIKSSIAESGASCAFPEFGYDASLLDSAIEGSSARIGAGLDPAGRGFNEGADLYENVLRGMATSLVDCLSEKG